MADINIQKKKPSFWPWVVGIILAAILIGILFFIFGSKRTRHHDNMVMMDSTQQMNNPAPPAHKGEGPFIDNPVEHWRQVTDTAMIKKEPMAMVMGLRSIVMVLDQMMPMSKASQKNFVDRRRIIEASLVNMENRLRHKTKSPKDSSYIVLKAVTSTLADIQAANYPSLSDQMKKIEATYKSLDRSKSIYDQGEIMNQYFDQTNALIKEMAEHPMMPPMPGGPQPPNGPQQGPPMQQGPPPPPPGK